VVQFYSKDPGRRG